MQDAYHPLHTPPLLTVSIRATRPQKCCCPELRGLSLAGPEAAEQWAQGGMGLRVSTQE